MGRLSIGICLGFIVALCLSCNLQNGYAASKSDSNLEALLTAMSLTSDRKIIKLPSDILDALFEARHSSQIRKLQEDGDRDLELSEQLWKQANKFKGSNSQVRQSIINDIETTQKSFQTIAVGVDPKSKKVLVAGNIKAVDFLDLSAKTTGQGGARRAIVDARITSVGFLEPDYPIIKKIVQKAYPGYDIKVLSLSAGDLQTAVDLEKERRKEDAKKLKITYRDPNGNEERNAQAHFFHAEMQILAYYKQHGESLDDGKKIVASKQYCVNCKDNLPESARETLEGVHYAGAKMRWAMPTNLEARTL